MFTIIVRDGPGHTYTYTKTYSYTKATPHSATSPDARPATAPLASRGKRQGSVVNPREQ